MLIVITATMLAFNALNLAAGQDLSVPTAWRVLLCF
jgi:hypothetical protein